MKGPGYDVVLGVVVFAAAVRVGMRVRRAKQRRRTGDEAHSPSSAAEPAPAPASASASAAASTKAPHFRSLPLRGDTWLVASREIRERMRRRAFRVVTLVMLAAVGAAIVIPVATRSKSEPQQIGVVGTLSRGDRSAVTSAGKSVGTGVRFVPVASLSAAESKLRSGDLDLVVVSGRRIVVDQSPSARQTSTASELAQTAAHLLGSERAIVAAHLTPGQVRALSRAGPLPIVSLQKPSPSGNANRGTSLIGIILIFVMLSQYNTWTLIGVMEEKSSRVVEVLLATVRPIQLLGGKVLGIGTVVMIQASAIVVFALLLAKAVGSDLLKGATTEVVFASLLWLFLGYAFYCWVYAAAGSLAERQDQVQTLALPLSIPMVFGYIIAITAASSGTPSLLVHVLAFVPPTAPFCMTVLLGLGAVTWWQFTLSALISVAGTIGVAWFAAGIYRRAVLRTGHRVRVRELVAARN